MADGPGREAAVHVVPLGRNRYHVVEDGRRRVAYAAGPGHARWVFLDGHVHLVDVTGGVPGGSGPETTIDEQLALASPMPASVAAVHVAAGQRVRLGDVLVTLEAMKMELPVTAPRDGVVRDVRCARGDLVQPGVPLVQLE